MIGNVYLLCKTLYNESDVERRLKYLNRIKTVIIQASNSDDLQHYGKCWRQDENECQSIESALQTYDEMKKCVYKLFCDFIVILITLN